MGLYFYLFLFCSLVLLAVIGFGLFRSRFAFGSDSAVLEERVRALQSDNSLLREDLSSLQVKYDDERSHRLVAEEQVRQKDLQMSDWQTQRERYMEASKSAVSELSEKLLKDYKVEGDSQRGLSERLLSSTTKDLREHSEKLSKMVSEIEGRVGEQESGLSSLRRVLLEPSKLGTASELILENTLKAYGLSEGQDFLLQHSFSVVGGRLRPDAIVFLPNNCVLVIDSKASVALSELAMAEGSENDASNSDEALERSLHDAMRKHVRDLSSKDYISAVERGIKSHRREFRPSQVITFLWLSSDSAFERVRKADSELVHFASDKGIFVVGPSGLQIAIGMAGVKITAQKQSENQSLIVKEAEALLQYVAKVITYAEKVGRGLQSASTAFDELANSVNRRLLPKARKIIELGVSKPQGKFGKPMQALRDDTHTIESELEFSDEDNTQIADDSQ